MLEEEEKELVPEISSFFAAEQERDETIKKLESTEKEIGRLSRKLEERKDETIKSIEEDLKNANEEVIVITKKIQELEQSENIDTVKQELIDSRSDEIKKIQNSQTWKET